MRVSHTGKRYENTSIKIASHTRLFIKQFGAVDINHALTTNEKKNSVYTVEKLYTKYARSCANGNPPVLSPRYVYDYLS